MRLKKHYTSREVAGLTGLTARQLQWWDARRLFMPAIAPHRTEAGGYTERRYTPLDVLELHPQVTFFVGENGSGKSTLLEAIAVAWGFEGSLDVRALGEAGENEQELVPTSNGGRKKGPAWFRRGQRATRAAPRACDGRRKRCTICATITARGSPRVRPGTCWS